MNKEEAIKEINDVYDEVVNIAERKRVAATNREWAKYKEVVAIAKEEKEKGLSGLSE